MNFARIYIALGAALAGLAVALGAFGAHGLKKLVSAEMLAVFETGVRYQMYHALGLLDVGGLLVKYSSRSLLISGLVFLAGIILFSGSLYGLTAGLPRGFGIVTPFGGVCFLVGWGFLAAGAWKSIRA